MRKLDHHTAIVLFSGGQDSAISLAWALSRYHTVETIGFRYGQRHDVELEARQRVRAGLAALFPDWAKRLGPDLVIDIPALGSLGDNALTHGAPLAIGADGLPTSFVPGRNLVFLAFAAAHAYARGAGTLVGGMCEADFSGYPDCRRAALDAQTDALRLGMDADFVFEAPLMALSKAHSWALAHTLGGAALVELVRVETHTCYLGDRTRLHDWGYGCGTCFACELRARGWRDFAGSGKNPDSGS